MVYIMPRLLNDHSINSFGIDFKFFGIMICNRCICFIDLIIWFVQCLINFWHWWLGSSRFILCCALSRSPPDFPVVISKRSLVMVSQGASWVLDISWKYLVQGENLSIQQRVDIFHVVFSFDARLIRSIFEILNVFTPCGFARFKECLSTLMLTWLCCLAELFLIESILFSCLQNSCWF